MTNPYHAMSLHRQFCVHHCLFKPQSPSPAEEKTSKSTLRFGRWTASLCLFFTLLGNSFWSQASTPLYPLLHPNPVDLKGEMPGLGVYAYQWYALLQNTETASKALVASSIGDYVWKDCDQDGIQDPGEEGVADVPITLTGIDDLGNTINEVTFSNLAGGYSFNGLNAGLYTLEFGLPLGLTGVDYTLVNTDADTLGSDPDPLTGRTIEFRVENNKVEDILDAGFIDIEAPVLLGIPADTTVACNAIPAAPELYVDLTATDNWSTDVNITFSENSTQGINGPCSLYDYIIIRTWSADDGCGNSIASVQIITVKDSAEPTFANTPADITINPNQGEVIPPVPDVDPIDDCDPNVIINLAENDSPSANCGFIRIRTWTVEDACGNQNAIDQRITVLGTGTAGTASSNSPLCAGDELQLTADGGNSYTWTGPDNFSSTEQNPTLNNVSPLQAGTYSVLIDDGSCSNTIEVPVTIAPALDLLPSITNAGCMALGSITLSVSGGTGPYTFDWQDLPGDDNPGDRSDLNPGSYQLQIRDAGVCTLTETLIIGDDCLCSAAAGTLTPSASPLCLNGPVLISAQADGNAVVPNNYSIAYVLTTGVNLVIQQTSTTPEFVVAQADEYRIHSLIYDPQTLDLSTLVLGQSEAAEVNALLIQGGGAICGALDLVGAIIRTSEATASIESINEADCDAANGSVTLSPASNDYQWSDGGQGAQRNDLAAGIYTVIASNGDACSTTLRVTIPEDCSCVAPEVTDIVTSGSTCAAATGYAVISTIADPANYVFEWQPDLGTPNATNNRRDGLIAGVYAVRISDPTQLDCSTEVSLVIANVDASIVESINTTPATCALADGSAMLLPDFFTYRWSIDGVEGNSRDDLAAGTYEVLVFDQSVPPCPNVVLVDIPEENLLQVNIQVNRTPTCQDANGSATINVLGGSGDYSYSWGPDARRDDLPAGVYAVTVTDLIRGCESDLTFSLINAVSGATIDAPSELQVSCAGATDAQLDYELNFSANFAFPADTFIISATDTLAPDSPLAPGAYCLIIQDGNGCLAGQHCFSVSEPLPIIVDVTLVDQDCFQAGSIQLEVSGGNGNYAFNWSDITGPGQPQNRTGLTAGSYRVTIRDGNDCRRALPDLVIGNQCPTGCIEPVVGNTLIVEATCGEANGSISLEMQGNPNQFNYTWTPDLGIGTAERKTNLPAGLYEVLITNAVDPSCSISRSIVVENVDGPTVNIINISPALCLNSNGAAVLSPITYDYQWCNGNTNFNPIDLPAGTCYVTVTDPSTACSNVVAIEIPQLNLLDAQAISQEPTCGQTDGRVDFQVLGGSGNYDFKWNDGAQGAPREDMAAGQYCVTVTDLAVGGCSTELDLVLTDALTVAASVSIAGGEQLSLNCAGQNDGRIDFTINYDAGFAFPADTIISDGSSEYDNGNLGLGNYCLIIRDASGCLATEACFEVIEPEPMVINATVTNKTCADDGSITIAVAGGTGNYSYNWSHLPSNNNPSDLSALAAGVYQLTIIDENNCEAYAQDLIVVDECLTCPSNETMMQVIPVNTSQTDCIVLESCFDASLTNILLSDADQTGQSPLGTWTLGAGGCLEFNANNIPGNDTICIIAQFGNLLDTTCFIYSVFEIPTVPAITDTLYLSTPEITAVDSCLSLAELGGVFTDASIVEAPRNMTGSLDLTDNCIRYLPNPGSLGDFIDTMLVEVCNNQIPMCDTTVIIVSVTAGPACTPVFEGPDTLNLFADDCASPALYCLDSITPFSTQFYTIELDDVVLNAPFDGCNLDTLFEYDLDQILSVAPFGPYELVQWVVNADTFRLASFQTFEELVDSMNVWDPLGDWERIGDGILGGSGANQYSDLDVESLQASIMDPIPLDPLFTATGTQIPIDTGFHQLVVTLDSTGCSDTLWFQVDCDLCLSLYSGPDSLMADSCQGTALLCLDIDLADLPQYTFEDNGAIFGGEFRPCVIDTSYQYVAFPIGSPGIYELLSWEVDGMSFSIPLFTTVAQLADSMQVWDPAGNWQLFGFVIVGGNPSSDYGDLVISSSGNPSFTVAPQIINDAVGLLLPPGLHELVVTDNRSTCVDSITVNVLCDTMMTPPPPPLDTLLTVFENDTDTLCFDNFQVITFVENLCPDDNDGNVFVEPLFGTNCIAYSGLELGLDTFCLEICDGPICDTAILVIEVLPVIDTIPLFVNVNLSDTFCIDTTVFHHPVDTFYNFCEASSGVFVDVTLIDDGFCVEYTGLTPGIDTACLVLCDTAGFCDTTILVLSAKQTTLEVIDTTVLLGDFDTLCINTSELMGEIDTFFNDCARISGVFVDFTLDQDSICVIYDGRRVGTDTACLVVCDELGICDTTILIVTTIEEDDLRLPIAVRDTAMTTSATPIEIEILANDTINGNLINILIIDQPLNGVVSGMGFNLVYLPDPDFCDQQDSFTYAIQNEVGWDTTTVVIEVLCTDLKVYTGFSPNADGTNDTFLILGIEQFPNNRVAVYNRWGNLVFERRGYTNDDGWDGSWNGNELPDGTYFYLVDDGEGRVLNGYVQLHR